MNCLRHKIKNRSPLGKRANPRVSRICQILSPLGFFDPSASRIRSRIPLGLALGPPRFLARTPLVTLSDTLVRPSDARWDLENPRGLKSAEMEPCLLAFVNLELFLSQLTLIRIERLYHSSNSNVNPGKHLYSFKNNHNLLLFDLNNGAAASLLRRATISQTTFGKIIAVKSSAKNLDILFGDIEGVFMSVGYLFVFLQNYTA